MRIFLFHLMPYADLDLEGTVGYDSVWVNLPNRFYDPKKGAKLYNRYLDELTYGEEIGFDGICVNEHHQTAYGMMPSPIVMASALSQRTRRAKIAILGSALPLRDHPLTLAEEHAMIDNLTEGRLITGFVRGIGAEYHTFGTNPAFSHDRFHEAHDLIIRAWTETEPFVFAGDHYRFNYVSVWPRPYQVPHPPVWIPSQGSRETIDWAAHPDRRYTYLQTFSPLPAVRKYLKMYRDKAQSYGYEATDEKLGWAVPIYVARTDDEALAQAKVHFETFRNRYLKMPLHTLLPPGYSSIESMRNIAAAKAQIEGNLTAEKAIELGMFICGSPDTVTAALSKAWDDLRFGNILCMMQFATLPADLTRESMTMFAEHVMPRLRRVAQPVLSSEVW